MIEDIVRETVGRRLMKAAGTYHLYNGQLSADPIGIWLTFEGVPPHRFAGASDGWHFLVDNEAPKEIDMQDSGVIRMQDMSVASLFGHVMDQRVRRAWLIVSRTPEDVIGIRFDFDTVTVRILNWGDSVYVARELPCDADAGEIT